MPSGGLETEAAEGAGCLYITPRCHESVDNQRLSTSASCLRQTIKHQTIELHRRLHQQAVARILIRWPKPLVFSARRCPICADDVQMVSLSEDWTVRAELAIRINYP
jgi:hypothetical protein